MNKHGGRNKPRVDGSTVDGTWKAQEQNLRTRNHKNIIENINTGSPDP